ncbi:hypothetical protein Tco_1030395 [Tanacetum coccineum]|uniref:Transposase (Putative), gypsy type n=1 Tax=Tanacetum coccineum TaxID=301880 RepID=A0ABQ5G696_9ASTR
MDLFSFIRHFNPTKVLIGERNVAHGEVKLLMLTEGRVVPLVPSSLAASGGSNDSIDKLFDDGNDAELEHPTERDDDVLAETIAKDVSEVVVEKTKKSKPKRKAIGDASGPTFPPKKLREDYHVVTSNIREKSLVVIRGLIPEGFSISSDVMKPRVVTSMTPTLDCRNDGPADSMSGLDLQTYPPAMRYVVSSDDSHHSVSRSEVNSFNRYPIANALVMTIAVTTTIAANVSIVPISKGRVKYGNLENFRDFVFAGRANANVASSSKLNEPATSSGSFYASQDLDSKTLHHIYVPKWKVTNDSILDDPYVCHDLTNRLASPALFSQLRAMDYDQLYTEFNKDKLEDKCAEQATLLSEKDTEIADLKSLLSLKEAEAAEAIRLRGQLSVVEAADAAKGNELKGLKEKNLALEEEKNVLSEKVTTLESVIVAKENELASFSAQVAKLTFDLFGFQLSRDELSSKMASLESERDSLADQLLELDAQLLEMAAHLEKEFYPRFLTTISGRWWILTYGLKLVLLKCLHSFEYLCVLGETIGCAINKEDCQGVCQLCGMVLVWVDKGEKKGEQYWLILAGSKDRVTKEVVQLFPLYLKFGKWARTVLEGYTLYCKFSPCGDTTLVLGVYKCLHRIDHGKTERDLSVIEAYDPFAEAKYVDAVNALCTMDFSLISILKAEDDVVLGETSLSFLLQVIHSRVQRVRGKIIEKCLSLTDVMVPLVEPLSSKSLIGEASTSAIPATVGPTTTLSTTFASFGVVHHLLVSDYQVLDMEPHDEDPPAMTFEE